MVKKAIKKQINGRFWMDVDLGFYECAFFYKKMRPIYAGKSV